MKQSKWQYWLILGVMTVLSCVGILYAQPSPAGTAELKEAGVTLEKVDNGVYALISSTDFPAKDANTGICNAGIVIGSEGVLVIDPFHNQRLGNLVLKTVKELTDKPIRYVLNTHYHFDHTGGNAAIAAQGIPLIGRGPIRDFMLTRNKSKDPTLTPPTVIINGESIIWLGDKEVKIERSEGHSGGTDLTAYVPESNVLFTGDILFHERIPYVADGNIKQWTNSLAELEKNYQTAKIVPGHGSVTDSKGLKTLRQYFEELKQLALTWQEKGLSKEQAVSSSAKVPAQYEKYKFQTLYSSNLETAYYTDNPRQKMSKTEARVFLLDFEKPLWEIETRIEQIKKLAEENNVDVSEEVAQLEARACELYKEIFSSLNPLQRLQVARHPRRPSTLDYIQTIFDDWFELHGDRGGEDDPALVGGVARLNGRPVVVLGHQKGRDTKDNVARNFGMPLPGGYRKAWRLMEHAHQFSMPIITFIDTPGAWAGVEAERLGQGEAIAYNLREMFRFEVPIICTVIGEGGSGGALGIGVGDRLLMLEHAVYTVATPEACAAILWKDAKKAEQAAEALKITPTDLIELGIIDEIIPEPPKCAHSQPVQAAALLKKALMENLEGLTHMSAKQRCDLRYQKFRQMGAFLENAHT